MNNCIFAGNTCQDIEIKQTQSGTNFGRFSLAVTTGYGDKAKTSFLPMTVWGKTAESMSKWVKKGTRIVIQAEAIQNNYTNKDGNKVNNIEFTVRSWEFGGSKKDSEQASPAQPEEPKSTADAEFMNIADNIDEELPFS